MKKPLWGEHESYNPLPPPPRPSFWQGLGGTIKVVVGIALALAVIIGAAYLFAVYFPQIGSLTNPPAAPTATTAPTPTFTPLPTPTPTAQPTPSPTPQPSPSPSPSPTAQPSPSPSPQPSPTVMPSPTPARP